MAAVLATACAAGVRTNYRWPVLSEHGPADHLSAPIILPTAQGTRLIWDAAQSDTGLTVTQLMPDVVDATILPYPDVDAQEWQAVPAASGSYHIVWLDSAERLRSALIDTTTATTQRGPVELASGAAPHFVLLALSNGQALVLWKQQLSGQLQAAQIDQAGRPLSGVSFPSINADAFAASRDRNGALHLAWLTAQAPGSWSIKYLVAEPESLAAWSYSPAVQISTLSLALDEALVSFTLGLDHTHVTIFWSITTLAHPEIEHVWTLAFPLGIPASIEQTRLEIPTSESTPDTTLLSGLHTGPIMNLDHGTQHTPAAVCWPHPAQGQHHVLPLALTLYVAGGWRPAVVYFQAGRAQGYQIVSDQPADAGPPGITVDESGDITLAWYGLRGAFPTLFSATTQGKGLTAVAPWQNSSLLHIVAAGLLAAPLGLLWVILPLYLMLLPRNIPSPLLMILAYHIAKRLWPVGLCSRVPPALAITGFESSNPSLTVWGALLLISIGALGLYTLVRRIGCPARQAALAYMGLDLLLTWAVFGANLSIVYERLW